MEVKIFSKPLRKKKSKLSVIFQFPKPGSSIISLFHWYQHWAEYFGDKLGGAAKTEIINAYSLPQQAHILVQ